MFGFICHLTSIHYIMKLSYLPRERNLDMALITSRTCDVDASHGEADQYDFGFSGEYQQADLCAKCAAALEKALSPYTAVGVAVSLRELLRGVNGAQGDPAVVRAWLNSHGRPQGDRGRISAEDRAYYAKETGQ